MDYTAEPRKQLEREATITDIAEFVAEFINSDVVGLVAVQHLMIADQSQVGVFDPKCYELAFLHSQAVDYPKNGIPVDIHDSPRLLIRNKPDWKMVRYFAFCYTRV